MSGRTLIPALLALALLLSGTPRASAQVRIAELTLQEQAVPVRLVGYGLVVGLDGTGDRTTGGRGGGQTVQSVANLLRRFNVDVPGEMLRTRNVAAVLVTAEVSPFLRAGGRFEVHVSSLGDARSLRGGVLWVTPLVGEVGGDPVATAQGPLLISDGSMARSGYSVETTARLPAGGLLELEMPRPQFASSSRLLLREPELNTAIRIAAAVNEQIGEGTASVEDPGSITLALPADNMDRMTLLSRINDLRVQPVRTARLVIDGRDGTVVAGGELAVGEAVVSHGAITLMIGAAAPAAPADPADPLAAPGAPGAPAMPAAGPPGSVQVPAGTSVQQIAAALHAFRTPPVEIASIFESLRQVGALSAEVVVR